MSDGSDSDSRGGGEQAGRARNEECGQSAKAPRHCRVDGCNACLMKEKKFYRRSRCCQMHARELQVMLNGEHRRFCQQCCGFHQLSAFDGVKRSCRERLEAHNSRQREKWTVGGRRRPGTASGIASAAAPKTSIQRHSLPARLAEQQELQRQAQQRAFADADLWQEDYGGSLSAAPDADCCEQGYSGAVNNHSMQPADVAAPWDSPPSNASHNRGPNSGGAIIGGLASPGGFGSPSSQPPRGRRTIRSKSEKIGGWAAPYITAEDRQQWSASGVAVEPHLHISAANDFSGNANMGFSGATLERAGDGSNDWSVNDCGGGRDNLFKHNSCDATQLLRNRCETPQGWPKATSGIARHNPFKRMSIDSQTRSIDRDGSYGSATSSGNPWRGSAAVAQQEIGRQRSLSADEFPKHAELGLHDDEEARAFTAQAPDPLWLAQRLMGADLEVKYRPEYSYSRPSMDSATAALADKLDAAMVSGDFSLLHGQEPRLEASPALATQRKQQQEAEMRAAADLQAAFAAEAANGWGQPSPVIGQMSPEERAQAETFFKPSISHLPSMYLPRRSNHTSDNVLSIFTDNALQPGWDTHEANMGSIGGEVNGLGALTADMRHEELQPWGPVVGSYGMHGPNNSARLPHDREPESQAAQLGSCSGLGPASLAAMGQQYSAPAFMMCRVQE